MVVIGALLFGVLLWRITVQGAARIVIPPQRLEIVRQAFLAENRRHHDGGGGGAPGLPRGPGGALSIRPQARAAEQPVAQRRLAQIASFVEANPHRSRSDEERAAEAVSLGLHHGDLVVRRILIDGARRLIRAVVLTRQPDPAMVEEYLAANREPSCSPRGLASRTWRWTDSSGRRMRRSGPPRCWSGSSRSRSHRRPHRPWATSRSCRRRCRC